jgi:uncharacterized protein YjbI with pentapeptide repeats
MGTEFCYEHTDPNRYGHLLDQLRNRGVFTRENFEEMIIRNVKFLDRTTFSECDFKRTDLVYGSTQNASFYACDFTSAFFLSMSMEGAEFTDCTMADVTFSQCDLIRTRFSHLRIERATFSEGTISALELAGAELSAVKFLKCKLGNVSFRDAVAEKILVRNCEINDIDIREDQKGTILFDAARASPEGQIRIHAVAPAHAQVSQTSPSLEETGSYRVVSLEALQAEQHGSLRRFYRRERAARRGFVTDPRRLINLSANAFGIGMLVSWTIGWFAEGCRSSKLSVWLTSWAGFISIAAILAGTLLLLAAPSYLRDRKIRDQVWSDCAL